MSTRDTKEYRAIKDFFENSSSSQSRLLDPLISQDSLANKNAIALVASLELEEFLPLIIDFYESDKYITSCISALAAFKDDQYIPLISKYYKSENEKVRFVIASALKTIDSHLARQEISRMQNDTSFLVRTLVLEYLKK
jgi:HEAT repeat protein